jgi:hypothetical protein
VRILHRGRGGGVTPGPGRGTHEGQGAMRRPDVDAWRVHTLSGAELELHEALLALERLLGSGQVRPTTRIVLCGATRVLRTELSGAAHYSRSPRMAAPK